jgi:hypothetical protein
MSAENACKNTFMNKTKHKYVVMKRVIVRAMMFNATFNNISVISWLSVLLVEETEYQEKTSDLLQVTDKLYYSRNI